METKEAILETINELSNADFKDTAESASNYEESTSDSNNIFIDIKEEIDSIEDSNIDDELALLLRLKEKSLVLFEGLRSMQNDDAKIKLEMVISYLEYQLYLIEDRLKSINSTGSKQ